MKDRIGYQRGGGGSEWEPIKILSDEMNPAYVPNSTPGILTHKLDLNTPQTQGYGP